MNLRVARYMMPLTAALQGLCGITCGLSLSQSQSFGSTLKRDSPMHDQCLTLKIMTHGTYNKNISVRSSIILQFSHTNLT